VIAPSIDYSKPSLEEELLYIVEKFSPDLIIGSSMGGFVGMMIANRYNIECILYNPAIHSRPMEPNLKSLQYDDIKHSFNPIVILGMEDDVINPLISKEMLDDALSYCNIEEVEGLGHRIPFDVFVDIYNKYAI
jgi:predicted esterase YcpF (UPF0227 family)